MPINVIENNMQLTACLWRNNIYMHSLEAIMHWNIFFFGTELEPNES